MGIVTDVLRKNNIFAVAGCSACQNLCTQEAISFPSLKEIQEVITKYRDEHPE